MVHSVQVLTIRKKYFASKEESRIRARYDNTTRHCIVFEAFLRNCHESCHRRNECIVLTVVDSIEGAYGLIRKFQKLIKMIFMPFEPIRVRNSSTPLHNFALYSRHQNLIESTLWFTARNKQTHHQNAKRKKLSRKYAKRETKNYFIFKI
jgi:hypothetical protein